MYSTSIIMVSMHPDLLGNAHLYFFSEVLVFFPHCVEYTIVSGNTQYNLLCRLSIYDLYPLVPVNLRAKWKNPINILLDQLQTTISDDSS